MKTISIVVPAYNESRRLPATLDAIDTYLQSRSFPSAEVIVVDDGSTDGTPDLVREYAQRRPGVRLLLNPGNRGKGYAVRQGMLDARGEWILFTDADLSTPIAELDRLLETAERTGSDAVIGARTDRALIGVRQSGWRENSGRVFNLLMRTVAGLPFRDTQCGFKLYSSTAARQIFSRQRLDGFSFDVEDLCIAAALGLRVVDVPVRWNNAEGTKVSPAKGIRSFLDLITIRWNLARGRYH